MRSPAGRCVGWHRSRQIDTRLAQDRAAQLDRDTVLYHIEQRLRAEQGTRGSFARLHVCPASSGDIPDERDARLVILRPSYVHAGKDTASPALHEAGVMLATRGNSPRYFANTLIFLAPDCTRLDELEAATRQYLAWKSIEEEQEILNLDAFQRNQARTRREHADATVKARIPEAYCWLLVPETAELGATNADGSAKQVAWREAKLQSAQEALAVRAARKLENEGLLITKYAGTNLRLEIDKVPLWRGERSDAVCIKQLADDFATYLYLPRLKDTDVLLAAIRDGVSSLVWERDTFAYADSYDAAHGRFLGLKAGQQLAAVSESGLLVKPEVAAAQRQADGAVAVHAAERVTKPLSIAEGQTTASAGTLFGGDPIYAPVQGNGTTQEAAGIVALAKAGPTRFYAAKALDPARLVRDADDIAKEVLQHLTKLVGASVTVSIEIHATIPDGASDETVRTVTENCRTLKFEDYGFEGE